MPLEKRYDPLIVSIRLPYKEYNYVDEYRCLRLLLLTEKIHFCAPLVTYFIVAVTKFPALKKCRAKI